MDGLVDRLAEAGIAAFGPTAAAARIEGSKTYAKELMRDCGVPTAGARGAPRPRGGAAHLACASYPAVLKADVLAAGKGVIIAAGRARGARGARRVLRREALRRDRGGARGVPRRRGAVAARALRRRARGAAGAGAGLQAHPRRRRGPEHRRHGQLLAGARASTARRPRCSRALAHQPIVDELRRRGTPYHGDPLRGPDDDRRRARACSSSTAASATPRPRRCSRGCAATCSSCSRPPATPGRARGRGARVVARTGP